MTESEIQAHPEAQSFFANWSRYCGAPKATFEGQFTVTVAAMMAEIIQERDRWREVAKAELTETQFLEYEAKIRMPVLATETAI